MIEMKDLVFAYPRAGGALFDGLSLSLPAGTVCGLLGPNGAGKSTLLKLMAGALFPRHGSCRVMGHEPAAREPEFLSDVFLLPEEIFTPPIDARAYRRRFAPLYPAFDPRTYDALLEEFELPQDRKLTSLSHGQKKKFLLAFGIAANTRLLILDEPSNGLDIPSKSQFRRVLVNHWREDRSILISTHQVHDLDGLIDSVVIVSDGRILLNQSLDRVAGRIGVYVEHEAPRDALYYEEGLEGYAVLREVPVGEETRVDLGLLFGLVTTRRELAGSLFEEAPRS